MTSHRIVSSVSNLTERLFLLTFVLCFCFPRVGFALQSESQVRQDNSKDVSSSKSDESELERSDDASWLNSESLSNASDVEFRVDNTVRFIRNERETKYSSSTVFYGDLAFDFVGDNGEIVVYSFRAQKFVLIDPIRRMRSVIDESELDRFIERIKAILRDKKDGFTVFMTAPSFTISQKEDEYFFQSRWIDYRATTKPFDDEKIADVYFRFVEAIGKLNVYMNPGVLTPLARVEANRKFMDESRFPEKIVTEIYPRGKTIFAKTLQVENTSTIARRLSERDRNRVNRAVHLFEQFQFVSFKTYFEKSGTR